MRRGLMGCSSLQCPGACRGSWLMLLPRLVLLVALYTTCIRVFKRSLLRLCSSVAVLLECCVHVLGCIQLAVHTNMLLRQQ
jgi:hypothetical protein